jgi:hypothetical protein
MRPGSFNLPEEYYELWHMRVDHEGPDYDKLLGVYSTQAKAEQGLILLQEKSGFRDHPDGFEILDGTMDRTSMTEGFIAVWGDEECGGEEVPPQTVWTITRRGPKDIPVWALGQQPDVGENGGDFAWRLMDEHYGTGNWTRDNDEFDQLRKFGNRGALHPRANLPSRGRVAIRSRDAGQAYFSLWHRRTDEEDRDRDMQLGTYSTRDKAEEAWRCCATSSGFVTIRTPSKSTKAGSTRRTRPRAL